VTAQSCAGRRRGDLDKLGDQLRRPRGAVRLDRPVVDLATDLDRDRRGDLIGTIGLDLLDQLSAGQRPRWTLVDAAWTPKPVAAASRDNGTMA
jgi:hypothetical protein